MSRTNRYGAGAAGLILAGAIHALSFADGPLPTWLLPFVDLIGLAFLAHRVFQAPTIRQGAIAGFLFGLSNFAVGLYWITISLHDYGGLPLAPSIGAVIILAAFEALFIALACALSHALSTRHLRGLMNYRWHLLIAAVWASCWTGAEWLRGTLFTGFPWLNIGYAHVEGVLSGWAPVIGVYGLAWLASFAAGAIALLARAYNTPNDAPAAIAFGGVIVIGLFSILLSHVGWSSPSGKPLVIRMVQGNIPQSEKFDPQKMSQAIDTHMRLAALPPKGSDKGPDIIVLPETVMPLFQDRYSPRLWQQWLDVAKERNATLIMGIPGAPHDTRDKHWRNGRDRPERKGARGAPCLEKRCAGRRGPGNKGPDALRALGQSPDPCVDCSALVVRLSVGDKTALNARIQSMPSSLV